MYDAGDCSFDSADDANIPVDVWLSLTEDDDSFKNEGKWRLHASNYMPRRARVDDSAYCVYSDNKEELDAIIREKILPLYKRAMNLLEGMCSSTEGGSLYYWS